MSRLSDAIAVKQGSRIALREPLKTLDYIDVGISEVRAVEDAYIYTAGIAFNVRAECYKKDIEHIARQCRRQIVEDVFGEFRPDLLEIYRALLTRDTDNARVALIALEHRMFSTEEMK